MSANSFIFALCFVNLVVFCMGNLKIPCAYNDEECLTKSTRAVFPKTVAGRPGQVEASDPLNGEVIDLDLPNLTFVLHNATLQGLLNCDVEDVIANPKKAFFDYKIFCPMLRIDSDYETDGKLDGVSVEGVGASSIIYKNSELLLTGYYGKHVDETGTLHTNITNFKLKISVKEINRNFNGISFGNKGSDAIPVEEKLNKLEEIIRTPIMYSFIRKYIKNLNKFLDIVPVKDIHYQVV